MKIRPVEILLLLILVICFIIVPPILYTNRAQGLKQLVCVMFKEQEMLFTALNILAKEGECNLNTLNIEYAETTPIRDEDLLTQVLETCDYPTSLP